MAESAWATAEDALLLYEAEIRRRRGPRSAQVDPVARLMDPAFRERLWLYDLSHIGPELPGTLHPKQQEALRNGAKHRHLYWGNQSGKTTLGAVDMVLSALGRHPLQLAGLQPMPPFTGWASALTWELWEKILLPELLTWIPRDRIQSAPRPHQQGGRRDIVLRADNGTLSRITGKAAEQGAEMYQSARVNKVWLDEEHPEPVWDEMQPRLLRYGGTTLSTMTPILGMTYVHGRFYEPVQQGVIPLSEHWFSHAGVADNPSISVEALQALRSELRNNPSQLAAREHGLFVRPYGAVYDFSLDTHGVDLEGPALMAFIKRTKHYGGLDLGKWRFAFSWGCVDQDVSLTIIDEVFSQNEDATVRAKTIHDQLKHYGVEDIFIYGDCADPSGITELNGAFERMGSTYRVWPVAQPNKSRSAGIMRVESLLTRKAIKVRRGIGQDSQWYVGMGAGSNGRPVRGSRLVWEFRNWQYPKAPDGKVQKDDPDDATADGADMMDELRYLVMQWLGPLAIRPPKVNPTMAEIIQADLHKFDAPKQNVKRYGHVLRQG